MNAPIDPKLFSLAEQHALNGEAGTSILAANFGAAEMFSWIGSGAATQMFRSQHARLLALATSILGNVEREMTPASALDARTSFLAFMVNLRQHQTIEDRMLREALSKDSRTRLTMEQFEREMMSLSGEVASLSRRYPTVSAILAAPGREFSQACIDLFSRIEDRFRREETDLFPALERATRPAIVAA